jgi:hypothetical protein
MSFFSLQVEQEKRRARIEQAVQKGLLRRINNTPKKHPASQPTPRLRLVWINRSLSLRPFADSCS